MTQQCFLKPRHSPPYEHPYDRLIVAEATVAGVPLITGEEEIQRSGLVRTVWD
jgi:hypothetical protein